MGELIELHSEATARNAMARARDALREGALIGAPADAGYVIISTHESPALGDVELAFSSIDVGSFEQFDRFADRRSEQLDRLLRRVWPGPVEVRTTANGECPHIDENGTASFCWPAAEAVAELTHGAEQCLLLGTPTGDPIATAQELHSRFEAQLELTLDAGPIVYPRGATVIETQGDTFQVISEGIYPAEALKSLACRIILFICTGNTCRSPMAEVLFARMLAESIGCEMDALVDHGYLIASAGVSAFPGAPASEQSAQLMRDEGLDLSRHQSQPLSPQLIDQVDLMVTMTRSHRAAILAERPDVADRVRVLAPEGDIVDPFGGDIGEYRVCKEEIEHHLRGLIAEFQQDRAA